jgi:hypothetical protein
MPSYRLHRLKDHLRQQFRWAPHVSGAAVLKPRDYAPAGTVEASTPYEAFLEMRGADAPLEVGDVLEAEDGSLRVCKFVGFEDAQWAVAEVKPVESEAMADSGVSEARQ